MYKQFYPTLYWAESYLSMLELKLIHVSKMGQCYDTEEHNMILAAQFCIHPKIAKALYKQD